MSFVRLSGFRVSWSISRLRRLFASSFGMTRWHCLSAIILQLVDSVDFSESKKRTDRFRRSSKQFLIMIKLPTTKILYTFRCYFSFYHAKLSKNCLLQCSVRGCILQWLFNVLNSRRQSGFSTRSPCYAMLCDPLQNSRCSCCNTAQTMA